MTSVVIWSTDENPLHDLAGKLLLPARLRPMYVDVDVMARQAWNSATDTLGPILGWTGYFDGKEIASGFGPDEREACKQALLDYLKTGL
jgi:hypothetical protein